MYFGEFHVSTGHIKGPECQKEMANLGVTYQFWSFLW